MATQAAEAGYASHFTFTASDATPEPNGICDAFLVLAAGNATVRLENSAADLILTALVANTIIKFRLLRVNSTNLTATLIGLKA